MKAKLLTIIVIATFVSPLVWFDQAYASCAAEIDYDLTLKESELAFTGTVTRLDNYDGPQKVTFFIHEVIKGEINTPKYILENSGLIFLENDTIRSSSVSVDYKIGKTYKVYVTNGETNQCTTKITIPPADYLWEPGPEDGNYYSKNPVYVDPCEEGYGLSDGVCITLEEMNKDLPTCSANPRHDFGKCKKNIEQPPNTFEQVKAHCDDGGEDIFLEWWDDDVYYNNEECEMLDRDKFGAPPPEPEPEQVFEDDKKRYCDYAVERDLPTPWKYHCYDYPIQNPQRGMDFGNPMLGDDNLLDCNDDDNPYTCFDDAFTSCTTAKVEQSMPTVEGDPVYTGAYIADDCKIHVILDNREDRWSSLVDRKITQSVCSTIKFEEKQMIISNCNDWNSFEFQSKHIFCAAGDKLVDGVCIVSDPQPVYGRDCEVLHVWNYAIDDCNFMINSINFIFSLLLPISIVIIVSIMIALKYKKKF